MPAAASSHTSIKKAADGRQSCRVTMFPPFLRRGSQATVDNDVEAIECDRSLQRRSGGHWRRLHPRLRQRGRIPRWKRPPSGVVGRRTNDQGATLMAWRSLLRMLAPPLLLVFIGVPSHAEYPERPLKIIVAWPPGGVVDMTARVIGEQLAARLGQPVVVENRVGANGNIGTTAVARAPADGYTLQAVTAETHAINPHVYKALTYDVFRDFDAVALLARSNFVLTAKAGLPVDNVQGLIALAKASPEKLTMATYGIGSTSHVTMASFEEVTKTSFLHVPYRGVSPVVNALLTGEVDVAFVTPHIVVELLKAGKVKILGAASLQRMAIVAAVPTFTEQGINGFVGGNWYGVVAPRGIPEAEKARLANELQEIAASPPFLAHARSLGVDAEYLDAAGFAEFLARENQRWGTLIKARKIEIP
jgi:tripartite-type tricarboxylate transporter receptor subunit TctC